jgi:hypothetical protein
VANSAASSPIADDLEFADQLAAVLANGAAD